MLHECYGHVTRTSFLKAQRLKSLTNLLGEYFLSALIRRLLRRVPGFKRGSPTMERRIFQALWVAWSFVGFGALLYVGVVVGVIMGTRRAA